MKSTEDTLLLSSRDIAGLLIKTCEKGHDFKFTARGASMWPYICDGDTITIIPLPPILRAGDIVAFTAPEKGNLIIHRIVKKQAGQYLLKGDNVFSFDGWIPPKNIHGLVDNITSAKKKAAGIRLLFLKFIDILRRYKKTIAALSRYNISTLLFRSFRKMIRIVQK